MSDYVDEEDLDSLNLENEEKMSFNDDFLLEQNAITPAEAFRPAPTIVTDIKAIVNTLNRDKELFSTRWWRPFVIPPAPQFGCFSPGREEWGRAT